MQHVWGEERSTQGFDEEGDLSAGGHFEDPSVDGRIIL
jgi:hypothetical protein